jgi:hypothetical protein
LNGAGISGLAARNELFLKSNGYTNVTVDTYQDKSDFQDYTRILVKRDGTGEDIRQLYPGSRIVSDEGIETDIVVILGKNEK